MKKLKKSIILSLSTFTLLTETVPALAQDIENNVNNDSLIVPYELSHTYSNMPISGTTSFETIINLSNSQPYGKAHFYNASSSDVKLYVEDQGIVIVKPYSSNSIIWKKSPKKNSYKVSVSASKETLNGSFSLAKATKSSEFLN